MTKLERQHHDLTQLIVHDIRSPLSALLMQLNVLQMTAGEDTADSVDAALLLTREISDFAETMLDVSRLEAGRLPLRKSPIDLVTLVERVRERLGVLPSGRVIALVAPRASMVRCDATLVLKALRNLVAHCLKHTPSGGRLVIEVSPTPDAVRITVQDEGDGVPVNVKKRIFDKFGTVAMRKDHTYHAVGLDLVLVRLVAEAHGGRIAVENVQPRGSVFTLELPA